jgi:hypothetical protein
MYELRNLIRKNDLSTAVGLHTSLEDGADILDKHVTIILKTLEC